MISYCADPHRTALSNDILYGNNFDMGGLLSFVKMGSSVRFFVEETSNLYNE
jgi:hypothetical protein